MGCTARLALASRDFADIAVGGWASAVDNVVIAAGQSTGANDRRGDLTSCAALPALTRTSSKPGNNPTALTRRSHEGPFPKGKIADKRAIGRACCLRYQQIWLRRGRPGDGARSRNQDRQRNARLQPPQHP